MKVQSWDLYPSFDKHEFWCRHCGRCEMDHDFMHMLQELRNDYGKPVVISSGYRCPDYNSQVSSTGRTGPHTTGQAADVICSGPDAHELLRLALLWGFTGIGVSQRGDHATRFIHLDSLDGMPRPTVWSY